MPRAQRESGHKVKVIRTDNEGEFIGTDFEAVLKKKGIQHQLMVPYNPQQNGVAERFNWTLQEGARTLLGRAGLPDPFWVTALREVALVKNKVLAIAGDKQWVPYTKWYGSAPAVNMLRAYGCMVVFHVPKEKRGNLEASGRWGVHLGLAKDHKGCAGHCPEEEISGVTEDGGEPEVEEEEQQQQQQDAPQGAARLADCPRRDVRPPNRLTYPSFGKPRVLCELPPGKKAISSKLIFRHKYGPDGELTRYKARLVAKGFQQTKGKDFDEIFAPVGKGTTLRVMLGMAANRGWKIKQMDITTAFLNGIILEELYMLQLEGLDDGSGRVCKLKKAIYGLKQAPRAWYHKLEETLLAGGFKKSGCDHSLFLLQEKEQFLMLVVYVDDILIFSKSSAMIEHVEEMLEMQFKCSKMGDVKYYLGMHVERDLDKGVLRLHQRKYCEGLAEKYGLQDGGKPATPLPSGFTVEPCADEEVVGESDRKLFHSMVGALNYAANHTRPDIAFATSRLASVVSRPSHVQLEAAKRLVRYVSATASVGLEYSAVRQRLQRGAADLGKGEMLLTCYTDASFNSMKADGTSIRGYVCLFGGGAVSWCSKKQNEVGLSSCETEYMALHHGVKEVVWQRRLLEEIGVCQKEPTVILCDNESAVKLAKNACLHGLTKHIRPKWHWVRRLLDKEVQMEIVKTLQQAADILTKRLAENEHWKGMKLAGMSRGRPRGKGREGPGETRDKDTGGHALETRQGGVTKAVVPEEGLVGQESTRAGGGLRTLLPGAEPTGLGLGRGRDRAGTGSGPSRVRDGAATGPGQGQGRGRLGTGSGPSRVRDGAATGPGQGRGRGRSGTGSGPGQVRDGAEVGPGLGQGQGRSRTESRPGQVRDGAETGPGNEVASWKIHNAFHVQLLKPYQDPNKLYTGRQPPPPPPVLVNDELEYEVESVLAHRRRRHGALEFLRREPESRPVSPESRPASPRSHSASPVRTIRAGRRVSHPRPPPVPGTHSMTLRHSTAPQGVPLPTPRASSLPDGPDPESDSLRAASPTVTRFLAIAITDFLFESTAASALVTELVDFAAAYCLDYATSLVAESLSASLCPPSVEGECALGTDVLEDRQEEFECFAASVPHLVSMLIALEGDPDAPHIPTPRSYAEAIEGPYSS
ncbi:unnamed protein product [Closterium sp. NIES-54]